MCNGTLTRVSDSNRVHVVYDDVYRVLHVCIQFVQFLTVSTCNNVHLISQDSQFVQEEAERTNILSTMEECMCWN